MAVRLRWKDGSWVALCAAEYPAESGDVYINDPQDYALRIKYNADWEQEEEYIRTKQKGEIWVDEERLNDIIDDYVIYLETDPDPERVGENKARGAILDYLQTKEEE